MVTEQQYVVLSLELHLFFGRIMKEHAIFLEAGFTPPDAELGKIADYYKAQFESVLSETIQMGNGMIRPEIVSADELITAYTLGAEQKTQDFTGIAIHQDLTRLAAALSGTVHPQITPELAERVRCLNAQVGPLVDGLIDFKTSVLNEMLSCAIFTANYPLLIDHIRREAKLYRSHLVALENGQNPNDTIQETELFWDQIMMEHALFIRGLLDPSENDLIKTSNEFASGYADLLQEAKTATETTIARVRDKTLRETIKYRDFKAAGTKGLAECKIRSMILPLLADHVLRESNHYIRLLRQVTPASSFPAPPAPAVPSLPR